MTRLEELLGLQFEDYWIRLGKDTSDTFNDCGMIPSEECFKGIMRSAYGMGWSQREVPEDGVNQ